jgi:hypothetical protein
MAAIDDNFPFNSFRKRANTLNRFQSSLLTQIRCGHVPLNSYLYRINRSETDLCQACPEAINQRRKETVNHYLFECEAYNTEREELIGKVTRRHLNLRDMMSDTTRMVALARYISKTGRFKKD